MRDQAADRLAGLVGQLELHRLLGLVLEDDGAVRDGAAVRDIADAQRDQVAAAQLAVDGEVEECEVTEPLASCKRIRIAQISRTFSGGLGPVSLPLFQGVRDERVCSFWCPSDMVCLLGGCRKAGSSTAPRGRRSVEPKRAEMMAWRVEPVGCKPRERGCNAQRIVG